MASETQTASPSPPPPQNDNEAQAGTANPDTQDEKPASFCRKLFSCLWKFYNDNEFVVLVVIAILLARAYPPLGADYLQPQITSTWIAVIFIFVLAGLGLKTEEFAKALQRIKFNVFVQCFSFFVDSSVVFGVSRLLVEIGAISQGLADGMVICASLPVTINMVLVLTKASGGDEAAAIFNAAFGNMLGVFLSPVLILGYLGVTGDIDLFGVFYKLALRVVVPVLIGQILQKKSKTVVDFVKKYKPYFKMAQQYTLVFIVYTVFCRTFEDDDQQNVGDIFIMIFVQLILLLCLMVLAWVLLGLFFRDEPKLRVMGLFGATHKTVAMGVPLINAIYEDNPLVGLYTLPLLIWHPMQLVVGSFLAPRLSRFVDSEKQRLGIVDEDDSPSGEAAKSRPSNSDEESPSSSSSVSGPAQGDAATPTTPSGKEIELAEPTPTKNERI